MRVHLRSLLAAAALVTPLLAGPDLTEKHEAGRCAIRGQCGKAGFLYGQAPCPDNDLAEEPSDDVRKKLVDVCGDDWKDSKVCCTEEQLDALSSNLGTVDNFLSSCPACKHNFHKLFCTFTCSPDQSLFINVTDTAEKGDKYIAAELDHLVSDEYGAAFYDSCKDVKFGATNSKAMNFIGGGAKNYTQFLTFLGTKRVGGSPFQMDFPRPSDEDFPDMKPVTKDAKPCNSTDEKYKCTCVDCASACPELPEVATSNSCHVGAMACLSFAVVLVYAVFIALLIVAVSGHVAYRKHTQSKNERLRLLQDAAPSDDEDEGEIVQNAGLLDRPQKHYWLNSICDGAFSRLGYTCAKFPATTIGLSIVVVALLSIGWINFEVERDPVRLWVAPDSAAAKEKAFFDDSFGPFFRAEQVFLVNDTTPDGPSPVLSYDTLEWWFSVEDNIRKLRSEDGLFLDDVCYKPTGDACVVQSAKGYFYNKELDRDTWAGEIQDCVDTPVDCRPEFGLPLDPNLLFGKYNNSVLETKALVTTWVVNNHEEDTEELRLAIEWEDSLINYLLDVQKEAEERGLRLSFNTEISVENELNKSANTDANIVVVSYIIMFIYASLALGATTLTVSTILSNPANAIVQSKFMLGVIGIVIVLMSVCASVGLFSAAGIKVTLIIAEVIPFLVLAVGVDNIFLIVHEFERVNVSHPDAQVPDRMSRALGRMGPSILLSALTEVAAISLGTAVGMPAVRNFAAYAAGAVFINALLQVTMFVSVLALNQQRVEAGRADCVPCIRVRKADAVSMNGAYAYDVQDEGGFQRFIRKTYAPALLGRKTRVGVIALFLGIFTAGLALIPSVQLGLDQRIAIPNGSYLIKYFDDLFDYFDAGPPVYFVTRELNVTERPFQKHLCGRFTTCDTFSMANVLEQESKRPNVSYLATGGASWLDDFFLYVIGGCCPGVGGLDACKIQRDSGAGSTLDGLPEGQAFIDLLDRWLKTPTNEECPLGGQAPYSNAIVFDKERLTVDASHFRASHIPLHSQEDLIESYAAARRIANDIHNDAGIEVFPYSKHYIFFDQYSNIVHLSCALLGSGLAIILLVTTVLLGSFQTALVTTVTVAMILVDIVGTMALANVSLNAVSLVNLVISLGIGVEFCAHIARAFTFPSATVMERAPRHRYRGKDARAWTALVNVGGSVFSGITVTKLLGVCVLAFTKSKIFEIYYFRVWLALVFWAALHALVFLPIALSFFGGDGYVDPESSGGLEEDLRSRRYPALLDEDDYDSDDF